MKAGMVIAIEPMFNLGRAEVNVDRDGWTVRTRDGSTSAHFEYTVAIDPKGAMILGMGRLAESAAGRDPASAAVGASRA